MTVVVTGVGACTGFGAGADALWQGLVGGRSAVDVVAKVEVRDVVRTSAGRRIDHVSLLALAAAREAVDDAGLDGATLASPRCGLVLGTALGNMTETTGFLDRLLERGSGNPLVFPNLVANAPLSYASIELGVVGPTAMVTEQEASGEIAIALAVEWVREGRVDVCLAGASDEVAPVVRDVVAETRGRGGPARGEGAGIVVVESAEHAQTRRARVWARITAGVTRSVPAPLHGWPVDVAAVATALAPLRDVDAVMLATDGTPAWTQVEGWALQRVFGARHVPATAPRLATGAFGAAGAVATVAGIHALAAGSLPPTGGCDGHPLDLVREVPRAIPGRRLGLVGVARGGICQVLTLESLT